MKSTTIHCQSRGDLWQGLDFSTRVKNLFPFICYRGDNKIEVNLTMNFGSRDKEKKSTLE
jgi:hypothetical protein